MGNYKTAIAHTLKYEGWYVNDPDDGGGETYKGISRVYNPTWSGWDTIDKKPRRHGEKIAGLDDDVEAFYKANYWNKIRLDEVCNDAVAGFVFDWYVNSGGSGIKAIQLVIGVKEDGIVGSATIHAINNYKGDLLAALKQAREAFYRGIVQRDPSKKKFLKGWLSRNSSF